MGYTASARGLGWASEWPTCLPLKKTSAVHIQNYFIKITFFGGKLAEIIQDCKEWHIGIAFFFKCLSIQNLHILDCSWNIQVGVEQDTTCTEQDQGCGGWTSFLVVLPTCALQLHIFIWEPSNRTPRQTRWKRNCQRLEIGYVQSREKESQPGSILYLTTTTTLPKKMRICHQVWGERVVRWNLLFLFLFFKRKRKGLTSVWCSCMEGRLRKQVLEASFGGGKKQPRIMIISLL